MRILDRYLIKEMSVTWLAVTLVLLVIMIGNVLARSLSRVTDGSVGADMVLVLVGVKSISLLVTLIPLGLYLGILLAHGRFYRDNEMAVMQACGVGWWDLMRPTVLVGLVGVLLISALTIFASPWASRYEQQLKVDMREQSALSLLTPGRFVESADGGLVFFVHEANANRTQFTDVFMYRNRDDDMPVVDTARLATYQQDLDTGNEYLVFTDGQSTVGRPGDADYALTEFHLQGVLRPEEPNSTPSVRSKGKSVTELLSSSENADRAELQWRISIPLAALILAMLAVPLSHTSPREGRFGKIAIAILVYIPYANLLVLSRKWIASGNLSPAIGLWPVHLLVVALVFWLLARRLGWQWVRQAHQSGMTAVR